MKKIKVLTVLMATSLLKAQVQINGGLTFGISNSNVMIDGSAGFSSQSGAGPYSGKGIIIPSVDLVNFQFNLTLAGGATFPTWFDGMIVYNNATGTTLTTGNRSSTAIVVTPGFIISIIRTVPVLEMSPADSGSPSAETASASRQAMLPQDRLLPSTDN
uniref:Uncharacterized protein n=1 Tax=Chryseobacterium endophyticum TaxID=1854762 RepID=A0AAU6WNI8_9FLAO